MKISKLILLLMIISSPMLAQSQKEVYQKTKQNNDLSLKGHVLQDLEMIISVYADDALLLPPGGVAPIQGIENIRKYYKEGFKAGKSLKITTENIGYQLIDKDHANEVGRYTIEYLTEGTTKPITIKGEMMIFWERNAEGDWKIKWDMWH